MVPFGKQQEILRGLFDRPRRQEAIDGPRMVACGEEDVMHVEGLQIDPKESCDPALGQKPDRHAASDLPGCR